MPKQEGGNCHRCGKYRSGPKKGKRYSTKHCNPKGTYKRNSRNKSLGRAGKVYRSNNKVQRTHCKPRSDKGVKRGPRSKVTAYKDIEETTTTTTIPQFLQWLVPAKSSPTVNAYKDIEETKTEISNAYKDIEETKTEISNAYKDIEDKKDVAYLDIEETETEISNAYKEIEETKKELTKAYMEIQETKKEITKAYKDTEDVQTKREMVTALKEIEETKVELKKALKDIEETKVELKKATKEIEEIKVEKVKATKDIEGTQKTTTKSFMDIFFPDKKEIEKPSYADEYECTQDPEYPVLCPSDTKNKNRCFPDIKYCDMPRSEQRKDAYLKDLKKGPWVPPTRKRKN